MTPEKAVIAMINSDLVQITGLADQGSFIIISMYPNGTAELGDPKDLNKDLDRSEYIKDLEPTPTYIVSYFGSSSTKSVIFKHHGEAKEALLTAKDRAYLSLVIDTHFIIR